MKYIDSKKLIAEIDRRMKRCEDCERNGYPDTTSSEATLKSLRSFITSLQQEQPMPDSTKLIEFWNEDKEMLKEKDFRDDPWRLAYNAFMCGFVRGVSVKKQEQNCIFGNTPSEDACKYCGVVCSSRVPKIITSTSTKVSPSPEEIADKDEQIGLSIMAYLDSNIKSDKHKVCGVPLNIARKWIRKMIAYSQEQPEVDLEEELDNYLNNIGYPTLFTEELDLATHFYELGQRTKYQQDRAEFAKLKAKEWQSGYHAGYAKGLNARKEE